MSARDGEAPWKVIVNKKRAQRDAAIPPAWKLNQKYLPKENGEPENVLSVPYQCGILTARELHITSRYNAASLVREVSSRSLSAREVTLAFCKRAAIAQQLTNCLTEPLFGSALERAEFLDDHLARHGKPFGPHHGLPI